MTCKRGSQLFLQFFYNVNSVCGSLVGKTEENVGVDRAGPELRLFAGRGSFVGISKTYAERLQGSNWRSRSASTVLWKMGVVLIFSLAALRLPAREKEAIQYGAGLIVNVPFSESEVSQVVQDMVQNGIIRGTKEYNKDEYVTGATVASSTRAFKEWTEGGKVFYKVRLKALDPQNFKNTSDVGTLAVRYVVQSQGDNHTVLRIDAVFVEDFRHVTHPSNGSVEGAEYKSIHDRLDAVELMKTQTADAEREKKAHIAGSPVVTAAVSESSSSVPPPPLVDPASNETQPTPKVVVQSSPQSLEQRVHDLQQQAQRLVKSPGAPLKSAPFHTATTLQSLPAGTEVLIVISTTYWLGVETHAGQYGWMLRDDLEPVP